MQIEQFAFEIGKLAFLFLCVILILNTYLKKYLSYLRVFAIFASILHHIFAKQCAYAIFRGFYGIEIRN